MRLENSYSALLKMALPLMLGTFIQSIVLITDAAFLSRYSTLSFDASGNAGLIYVTLFMGLAGLSDGAQIIMARRIGSSQTRELNAIIQSSFLSNLALAGLFFITLTFVVPDMIIGYSKNQEVAREQIDFLSVRSFGFFMAAIMLGLNAFFTALGKTWVIMLSTILFAASNIILDKLLIFGYGIIPSMGIQGAALASVLSEGVAVLVLITVFLLSKERKQFGLFTRIEIRKESLKKLFRIGFPLVIQGFFALATWTVFFTWIEQKSTYDLTVSQNIRAVYFLAFVPIFGFGATTKTYVAQYMDDKNPRLIGRTVRKIQLLAILFLLLFFHGAILYPETLISIINPNEHYLTDSAQILQIVFGAVIIFGFCTPFFQTINGSGNTKATLIIEIASIIIYLTFAYLFIKEWMFDIRLIWTVEYIYFGTIGLFSILYLNLFDWRKKQY
ncbi:MAG: MATE family efflux transporter [Brumimicrobium sp.]|nr:MATE family efflux transporter [Brumimicrobium sp.]